ncbi:MAG: OadG family protein [Clostridia bacterium]|nr:OadG family protein [Clostridia bacterium]
MRFFEEFMTDIVSIGAEFKDKFVNIPARLPAVLEQLPTALTGFIVVLSMLAIIAIAILVFSKVMYSFSKKKGEKETVVETSANNVAGATVSGTPLADGNSAGKLDLVDVDESTAAVIMAIVSDQSGIPLNRLNFKSIKKVEDK